MIMLKFNFFLNKFVKIRIIFLYKFINQTNKLTVLTPNLDRQILDRKILDRPNLDGHILDRTKPGQDKTWPRDTRHGHILDKL